MVRRYLVRGLKAGLVAGLALGLFVAFLANPMIGAAEELADEHDHGEVSEHGGHGEHGHGDEAGLVSTATTNAVGVLSGVFWGLLLGVLAFGLAFYVLEPAIPGSGAVKSAVVAAGGFVTVSAGPWLVLPPQPPGVEQALGTDVRLAIYVGTVVVSLATCLASGYAYTRLRSGCRGRAVVGAAVPLCLLVAVAVLLPVPGAEQTVPASLVAAFQAQVVFGQVVVWSLLATAHAWLLGRERDGDVTESDPASSPTVRPAD